MKFCDASLILKGEKKNEKTILVEEILRLDRSRLIMFPEKEVPPEDEEKLLCALKRLEKGEPLQYILGKWEFLGREYAVGEGVLIPREDTAAAIELAQKQAENPKVFADLGSGSGCIAVTLANMLKIKGFAVERSKKAFSYLEKNIKMADGRVECILGDMFSDEVLEKLPMLDIVISNPPYITLEEMKNLDKEVLREPHDALFGGEDGLDYYRKITEVYAPKLSIGGIMVFEVGFSQADAVIELLKAQGLSKISEKTDFSNIRRAVCAKKI